VGGCAPARVGQCRREKRLMSYFEVRQPIADATLPFIVHVPHSSTSVPAPFRAGFAVNDAELATELLLMTDRYTDELAEAATALGGAVLVNRVSRLVMDPERFADDAAEPMARKGMGAIYVSRQNGVALRRAGFSVEDRSRLIADLYEPYHAALEQLASDHLDRFGCCLLVDLHSFPHRPLAYEDASLARPQVCIGFDEAHVDEVLRERWATQLRALELDAGFNSPFAGSLVPSRFYQRDSRVRSLMIELRRDLYRDETTGEKTAGFAASLSLVTALLALAAERARELSETR
jgi:N-formylglutamate deformylase